MQSLLESELRILRIQDIPKRKWLNLSMIDMHNHISMSNSLTIILILTMILLNHKLVLSIIQSIMVLFTYLDMLHMVADIEDHRIDIRLGTRGIELLHIVEDIEGGMRETMIMNLVSTVMMLTSSTMHMIALNFLRKLTQDVRSHSLCGEEMDKRKSVETVKSVAISGSQSVHQVSWQLNVTSVLQFALMVPLIMRVFASNQALMSLRNAIQKRSLLTETAIANALDRLLSILSFVSAFAQLT